MAVFGPRRHSRLERTYADETPLATSFRVYTPAEIRTSRLLPRSSMVPPPGEAKMTPEALAKSFGIAAGALLAVFIAFLVIGNLTDDASNLNATGLAQARIGASRTSIAPPPVAPIAAPVEALPMQVVGDPPNDFELPDDAPVRTATKTKKKKKRKL